MVTSGYLSPLENLSCTLKLTESLASVNQGNYLLTGSIVARVSGAVVIPFSSLVDAAIHTTLCGGKIVTGIFISPYNSVAMVFFPKWSASKELELSSAFIHFICVIECVVTGALLPFICLINPERAHEFMASRYVNNTPDTEERQFTVEKIAFEAREEVLKNQNETLQARVNELEQQYRTLQEGHDLSLQEALAAQHESIQASNLLVENLKETIQNRQAHYGELNRITEEVRNEKAELERSMRDLTNRLQIEERNALQSNQQTNDLREAIQNERVRYDELRQAEEQTRNEKAELERRVQDLTNQLQIEERNILQSNQEANDLREAIQKHQASYVELNRITEEVRNEKAELERRVQDLTNQLQIEERNVLQTNQEANNLKETIQKQTEAHLLLKKAVVEAEEQKKLLEERVEEFQRQLREEGEQGTLSKEQIDILLNEIKIEKQKYHQAAHISEALILEKTKLEDSLQDLQSQLSEKEKQVKKLDLEIADLKSALQKEEGQRELAKNEAERLTLEKTQLEKGVQELRRQLSEKEKQMQNLNLDVLHLKSTLQREEEQRHTAEKAVEKVVLEKIQLEENLREQQRLLQEQLQQCATLEQERVKYKTAYDLLAESWRTANKKQEEAVKSHLTVKAQLEKRVDELESLVKIQQKQLETSLENSPVSQLGDSLFDSLVLDSISISKSSIGDEEVETVPHYLPEREPGLNELSTSSQSLADSITEHVANGKVKDVWVKTNRDPSIVYYTGKGYSAEMELRDEVKTAQAIRTTLKQLHPEEEEFYLAVDIKESEKGIKDPHSEARLYTVECKKADGDLEKVLTRRTIPLSFEQRLDLGRQALTGLCYLQEAGYVQGDLKPENILVYRQKNNDILIGISDFGKSKPMGPDEAEIIRGNPRFAPPEFKTSHKGEVFGGAMILIRILEEEFLDNEKTYLMAPYRSKATSTALRRGVEKFLLENGKCKQVENWVTRQGIGIAATEYFNFWNTPNPKAQVEIHKYIDELTRLMVEKVGKQKADTLNVLLKTMTMTNPEERPTMSEVVISYNKCIESV